MKKSEESKVVPIKPGSKIETVLVTPQMAEAWLEKNVNNRTVSDGRVEQYARDMKAGRWELSNDAVMFGKDGQLYNGQHRLFAVWQSGVSVWLMVMHGADESVRGVIDMGRARSNADNYQILTGTENAKKVIETANIIRKLVTNRMTASYAETCALVEKHRPGIMWAVETFKKHRHGVGSAQVRGALAFAYPTAPEKLRIFADQVLTGAGLQVDDPACVLRNAILNAPKHGDKVLAIKTLRAALAYVQGYKLATLYATQEAVRFFGKAHGYDLKGSNEDHMRGIQKGYVKTGKKVAR